MAKKTYEDGRLYDVGDVVGDLEVSGVSYREVNGEKSHFYYTFKSKADMDAERKVELDHQAELAKAAKEADDAAVSE